jgi:hypothetical protein
MEILLSQRKNTASILLLKDYCRLDEKHELSDNFSTNVSHTQRVLDFLDGDNKKVTLELPYKRDKRRTRYFYRENEESERVYLISAASLAKYPKNTFITSNDRHIKKHYGNPFASVKVKLFERQIVKRGNKITFRSYGQTKRRSLNDIYFKTLSGGCSVTFNLDTGNFTTVKYDKLKSGTTKTFRTNSFFHLEGILYHLFQLNVDNDNFNKIENNEFLSKSLEALGFDNTITDLKLFFNEIVQKFVEVKKIKVPNDYRGLLQHYYPTEKYLKKNDRKLVSSILDMFNIKSKVTVKMLHDDVNLNLSTFVRLCHFLGSDYQKFIGNVSIWSFKYPNPNLPEIHSVSLIKDTVETLKGFELSKLDKENICHLANDVSNVGLDYGFFNLLGDHFNMIKKLKDYYPDLKMTAKTMVDFDKEHHELTKLMSAIKKGWVVEYKFSDKMLKDVEKPIDLKIDLDDGTFGEITFYPHVLKREEEYDEEGEFMHHCVATYSNKDKSMIISLRTKDWGDRVTCEFDTSSGRMVQARHFCNKQPPADMELAIEELKIKAVKWARLGMLNNIEKLKVPVKINGIEVKRDPKQAVLDDRLFEYEVPF